MLKIIESEKEKYYNIVHDSEIINEFKITVRSIETKFQETVAPILNDYFSRYEESALQFKDILENWNTYSLESSVLQDLEDFFMDAIPNIIEEIDTKIDVSKFANTKKKTKTSVFVKTEDIKKLMVLSYCLKFHSLLFSTTNNYESNLSNSAFIMISRLVGASKSLELLYSLIERKLSVFKYTDKTMWLFIKLYHSKNYESIVNETFNFILSILLVIFDIHPDKNLITFLVVYIDQNIRWLLADSYNSNVTLLSNLIDNPDSDNKTLDEFINVGFRSDFIELCSYDNTLHYIMSITRNFMDKYNIKEKDIRDAIQYLYITPFQKYFVIPIVSKITNINYKYLVSRDKHTIYYMQIFLYFLFLELYGNKLSVTQLLMYGSTRDIHENFSIKMRKITDILEQDITFYGIKNKTIIVKLLIICSTISTRKGRLVNVVFPYMKNIIINPKYLNELIDFYKDFFIKGDTGKSIQILQKRFLEEVKKMEYK